MINLAIVLNRLKKYAEAVDSLDKVFQQDPNNFEAISNRSTSLIELGRYEDAIQDCNRALSLNPGFAPAYYNKAYASSFLGREEDVLDSFRHAIKFDQSAKERARNEPRFRQLKIWIELERLLE